MSGIWNVCSGLSSNRSNNKSDEYKDQKLNEVKCKVDGNQDNINYQGGEVRFISLY